MLWRDVGDDMANSRDREIDRTITSNLQRLSKYGVLPLGPDMKSRTIN
jgi:hypothetical protein